MKDILVNKQYKNYERLSRYSQFPIYYNTVDEKWVVGTTSQLSDESPYQTFKTTGRETYDMLALSYYNNPTLYWVICDFNHIQDCFEKPEAGVVLKIPVISSIRFDI